MNVSHRWARSMDHEDQKLPKKLGVWIQSVVNWTQKEEDSISDLSAYAVSEKRVFGESREVGLAHLLVNAVEILADIRHTSDRITKKIDITKQHPQSPYSLY